METNTKKVHTSLSDLILAAIDAKNWVLHHISALITRVGDLENKTSDLATIRSDAANAPALALRKLFLDAGATYSASTNRYSLNGLTDLTEAQMIRIYNDTYHKFFGHDVSYGLYGSTVRTTFKVLQRPTWIRGINGNNLFAGCTSMEVANIGTEHSTTTTVRDSNCTWSDMTAMFANCYTLKRIVGAIQPENSSVSLADCFFSCFALQEVYLLNLSQNVSFADSHYLSIASITTMIMRAATSPTIVITLAANVYADAMANSNVKIALNGHKNVSLASV